MNNKDFLGLIESKKGKTKWQRKHLLETLKQLRQDPARLEDFKVKHPEGGGTKIHNNTNTIVQNNPNKPTKA